MDVRLPDGTIIRNVPEGTTRAQLVQKLQSNGMAVPAEWVPQEQEQPAVVKAGQGIREIPRQIGLTARAAGRGLASIAGIVTDPLAAIYNTAADAVAPGRGPRMQPLATAAESAMTAAGLPEPRNATERVVQDAASMVAGAGGMAGAAGRMATAAPQAARSALQSLAARPGSQMAGAAAAGLSGGSVREAGGGPVEQFVASLAGGVAGGLGASKAADAGNTLQRMARRALTPEPVLMRQADLQIQLALNRSGINWNEVPERIRQNIRSEVSQALNTGEGLNTDALRRMLAFQRTGTTPTVGMLTQDPGQITREMNLAKTAANSRDVSLQSLPGLQNQNTARLLSNLDEMGAAKAPEAIDVSRRTISELDQFAAGMRDRLKGLYDAARDSQGRSLPLNQGVFNQRVNQLLDEANVGSFLPADIRNKINSIAGAKGGYPLTVDSSEQLKTSIAKLSRNSSDGNVREALRVVRQALDETPLAEAAPRGARGQNLPATQGAFAGEDAMAAFSKARSEYARWMARVEKTPALKAVIEGVEPDQFLERFVTSKQAPVASVKQMASVISPEGRGAIRLSLVRQLKDAATNNTDDIVKFSGDSYRRAIRNIGEDKLRVFFNKDEMQMLKDIGDAAKYMQAQPAGSAVNNSNSGALILGRGFDILERLASRTPIVGESIQGTIQGLQQRAVMQPSNALARVAGESVRAPRINPLVAAVSASPAQSRQDERRN